MDCDGAETVFGWKLFAGWRINPYLALEGGYADLGSAEADTVIFGQDVNGEISAKALFGQVAASVPLGQRVRVLAKLGVAEVDFELEVDLFAVALIATPRSSTSVESTEAVYGVGAEFVFTPSLLGRVEWERFDFEDGTDLFSASLIFQLGSR